MADWFIVLSDSDLTLLVTELRRKKRKIESEIKIIEEEFQRRNEYSKILHNNIKRGTDD